MKNTPQMLLLPTDFSEGAGRATERAGLLAGQTGAALHILHVVNRYSLDALLGLLTGNAAEAEGELVTEATRELDLLVDGHRARGLVARGEVVVGPVLASVLEAAERTRADLLIMGATGAGRFRELVLGTTTERVVRKATRNVLAVRRPAQGPYRLVLVAVDFSADSAAALAWARTVAPEAALTVLHAFEVPFEGKLRYAGVSDQAIESHRADARERAMEAMRAFLDSMGLEEGSVRPDVVHGYAPQRILQVAQALGCDLIVVGKHGRSPVEDVLVGSVTSHVLEYAEADVLVTSAAADAARA